MSKLIENAVIGQLVRDLMDQEFKVSFEYNGQGGIFIQATDGESEHWLSLNPDNGTGMISDYNLSFEPVIKETLEYVETLEALGE